MKKETTEEKQSYIDRIKTEIQELDTELENLKSEAGKEFQEQMAALRARRDAAETKLGELRESSEEAWDDLKEGLESSWNELKSAFNDARSKFNKKRTV